MKVAGGAEDNLGLPGTESPWKVQEQVDGDGCVGRRSASSASHILVIAPKAKSGAGRRLSDQLVTTPLIAYGFP